MEFEYKKSLGQNFIYDLGFLRTLVKKLAVQPTDTVVEVGAGAGTLTQALAETGCQVFSVEIDKRLEPVLQKRLAPYSNVTLTFADATKHNFSNLPPFRLIANVPYYITTPLIMQFLALPNCRELNVLVASEVAERIVAPHGNALYGALSVSCQNQAECKILASVPRTMFTPQPKVDSAFVSLKKNGQPSDKFMEKLLKGVFAARRKTMLNALSSALNLDKNTVTQILTTAEIDLNLRPEQITPTQYVKICALSRKYC
ncbi:MAG: ribosomal RNA small subunit methyltransferase A [Eubacteriales bacterium]|nr:ribosomal RNA small subunit methyltransferase A [Eubacteriales bacterium]